MALSRKNYSAVAEILSDQRRDDVYSSDVWTYGWNQSLNDTAAHLADYFAADNPRFDRARFLRACGVGE